MKNISEILEQLRPSLESRQLTLHELLDALRDRGPFFIIVLLAAPFLQPIALPGVSTPFGILIAFIAVGELIGREVPIPVRILNYALPRKGVQLLFRGAIALFRRLERWSKPHRFSLLVEQAALVRLHAVLILAAGILLMLPLPIPFSNSFPAYAIVFFALGYLLRDGISVLLAYAFSILTAAYFTLIGTVGLEGLQLLVRQVMARI